MSTEPLLILIAGPYRSGTHDDPDLIAANVRAMGDMAVRVFRAGDVPVLGEWLALPLIELAGSQRLGDAVFDEISTRWPAASWRAAMPAYASAAPRQARLEQVALARAAGRQVFYAFEEIPQLPDPRRG